MIKILDITKENLIGVRISNRIEKKDYEILTLLLEKTSNEHDRINLLVDIDSIRGIQPEAILEDLKIYFKYLEDIDKMAVVGNNGWHKAMAKMANPFLFGDVRYFNDKDYKKAEQWVNS